MILLVLFTLLLSANIAFPLAIPLAVRSPYLISHGRRPPIVLRFAIPVYLAGHKVLNLNVSDPRVVCPRASRQRDLFGSRERSF